MAAERRRSYRVRMTVPVVVEGVNETGKLFEFGARAIYLNRYGARIETHESLTCGQSLRLVNPLARREALFRVVEPIIQADGKNGQYGVEVQEEGANIWGIHFPLTTEGEGAEARGLVECQICRTIALLPLTLTELDAIRMMGLVCKPCQDCIAVTPWAFAQMPVSLQGFANGANHYELKANGQATAGVQPKLRSHRRIYLELPVGIRSENNETEITRTENFSRSGFCFTTERKYQVGEKLRVVCPFGTSVPDLEYVARIAREQRMEGSLRRAYGVHFERSAGSAAVDFPA